MSEKTDLDVRLEQYGVIARGQMARGWSVGEIAGYAAAVGSALAMTTQADAAIIYSGVQNLTLNVGSTNSTTHHSAPLSLSYGGATFPIAHLFVVGNGTTSGRGGLLPAGGNVAIGPIISGTKSTFAGSLKKFASGQTISGGPDGFVGFAGNWTASSTAFAGIESVNTAGTLQNGPGLKGWVRLHITESGGVPTSFTAIDWAFQFDPKETIKAGQTSDTIPEPPTLALLALGAVGIGAMRRRRKTPARPGAPA